MLLIFSYFIVSLIFLIIFLEYHVRKISNKGGLKNIPQPKTWPVIGVIMQIRLDQGE